ncbi:MAG: acyl carrier protein [Crocosphaera sp.]
MTDDQEYTLKIIKKVITSYLDENIPNNETGLNMLVNQCDDIVYKIASKIYTESGHKVYFFLIRDVIDSRIEPLQEYIARIKEEELIRLEAERLAEEVRRLQLEEERRKEEEIRRIQEEARILKEEAYNNELKRQLKESGRDETLYNIFSEIQKIVSEQLEVYLDCITLNSSIKDDLGGDYYDALELIMIIEEHFDIEITDDFVEEVNITIQPLFNWCSLSSGDLKDPYYSSDLTIGKLLDWIDTIKNEKIENNLI